MNCLNEKPDRFTKTKYIYLSTAVGLDLARDVQGGYFVCFVFTIDILRFTSGCKPFIIWGEWKGLTTHMPSTVIHSILFKLPG